MRIAFYIEIKTTQPDTQCFLELERAVGELTSERPIIKKIKPIEGLHDSEADDN